MRGLAALLARMWLYALLWLAAWVLVPAMVLGWSPVTISSGSMAPVVQRGDVLLLDPGAKGLAVGQIATFRTDRGLVSHRVVQVSDDGTYRTRGDANATVDSAPVQPTQVAGAARLVVPMIGLPSRWLAEWRWSSLAILVGVTGVAIVAAPLRERRGTPRATRRRRLPEAVQLAALAGGLVLMGPAVSAAAWTGSTPTYGAWTAAVLQAPTGVSTTYNCGVLGLTLDSITVEWAASTSTVDGYRILRSTDGGTLQVQEDLAAGTSWTDGTVESGKAYRYVVRSVSGSWISADTGENEATITTGTLCV